MTEASPLRQALDRIDFLEAQNARLRRLLDDADAPAELRHRLRSTVGLMRSIIRGTANSRRSVDDYVAHLDDRLDAITRAQEMIDSHGAIDLRTLLAEQMLFYRIKEEDRLTLDGPDVLLPPRIGQALALAIHELAVNSVEHGNMGGPGHVEVRWTVMQDILSLTWREAGPSIKTSAERGFGHEFITQGLPHQLDARSSLAIDEGLVLCTIEVPLGLSLQVP